MTPRVGIYRVEQILDQLTERDLAILHSVEKYRLLSTRQLQRLHFAVGSEHASQVAATRACTRVLGRLHSHRLLAHLERRIGGVRSGSAGYVWRLAAPGDRLVRHLRGEPGRRRFIEPSQRFAAHTLAVAEVAVRLHEAAKIGAFELVQIDTEPTNWRRFLGLHGGVETLKPDLHVITHSQDYEDHWFLEIDLGTEHAPTIGRKCRLYGRYAQTGRYQAEWGLFPAVAWIAPDKARVGVIEAAIAQEANLQTELFQVVSRDEFPHGELASDAEYASLLDVSHKITKMEAVTGESMMPGSPPPPPAIDWMDAARKPGEGRGRR